MNASYLADIEDIGLKVLVSIYCTRGGNFAARAFKEELREMELPMLACSKIYMGLQEWRREFESLQKLSITNVTAADATSVSSLGMSSPASV